MSDFDGGKARFGAIARPDMSVDAGLRSFMLGIYNKMMLGLLLSAGLAWFTGTYQPVQQLLFRVDGVGHIGYTILGMILAFAPIGVILVGGFMRNLSPAAASFGYWLVVSLIGASMGMLFSLYTPGVMFETFLVTAGAFGGLSLFGYVTKRDLSPMFSFLMMGTFGLLGAMLLSIFFHASAMIFLINLVGVLIFAGWTAYDTQNLKLMYYRLGGNEAAMSVATSWGALNLYLDFINMFRFLLYFMGGRR